MKSSVRRIALDATMLALALALSVAESFIPISSLPGFKPGLANIIILVLIYRFSWSEALLIDIGRIFLASLMTGKIFSLPFYMSLAGGIVSYLGMLLIAKCFSKVFSIYGASLFGSVLHCLGQIAIASILLSTSGVFWYFPLMALVGLFTGLVVGFFADRIIASGIFERLRL